MSMEITECSKCGRFFKEDLPPLPPALLALLDAAERDGLTVAVESCRCREGKEKQQ